MANSIRKKHQFSLQTLSNNLNEVLQDLDNALKSQPQLLLGSRNSRSRTPITPKTSTKATAHNDNRLDEETRLSLSSIKSDCCSPVIGSKSKEHSREQIKEGQRQKKVLRPQLSKIIITSLEFSEALPFAAFTSMLVEMVAKLDHVMDKVEELGRMSHFREFRDGDDDENIVVTCERPKINIVDNDLPSYGAE
jgi:hypothetical protein